MKWIEPLEARRLLANVPPGFVDSTFATGLNAPTAMEIAPDGRIFVAEQGGALRVVDTGGQVLSTPFVTVNTDSTGERGLLGIAFDPNFASNGFVYVYYTATTPTQHNRVSRFTANGNVAVPGSETVILDLPTLTATNHNGGAIHFGVDGKLYIGVGENANGANAQTLSNPLGKILRINSDGSIPTDNPFYNQTTGINRSIWALGLRNPFTFAIQPGTGKMFINDVGEVSFEEVNEGTPGANYGWPFSEGFKKPTDQNTTIGTYKDPIHAYGRDVGHIISGGVFYNPPHMQFPSSYVGKYLFSEAGFGWIHQMTPGGTVTDFATGIQTPVDLKVGAGGALYYVERGGGTLHRITYTSISGKLFNDANANGVRDAGEEPIAGVAIYIDGNNNGRPDAGEQADVTDANGLYVLGGLGANTYIVRENVPGGWRKTTPDGAFVVTLTQGQTIAQDFGNTQHILIAGNVYNDVNQNGVRDGNESGLQGWTVYVDLNNNLAPDGNEPARLTDAFGNYTFTGLFAGTGTLRIQLNVLYHASNPTSGSYSGTMTAGQIARFTNFGLVANFPAPTPAPVVSDILATRYDGVRFFSEDELI